MHRRKAALGCLILALCVAGLPAADKEASIASDKQALAELQAYVGVWKGVGLPRRGSSKGAWSEQADWAWKFSDSRAAIAFQSPQGKYFHGGELRPGSKPGTFELLAMLPDGKTQERFAGSRTDGRLVLKAVDPAPERPTQVSIRQVAGGDRMLILLEHAAPGSELLTRLAEVGYTRQGSNFGKGNGGPECIVTGGYGSIAVTHKGQTYYVCCTGCRDLFNDDPDGVLAEYRQRKEAERAKGK